MIEDIDWIPAQRVHLRPGILVRVRHDAFTSKNRLGDIHNGRLGEIVEIKAGDVVVKTTDGKKPQLDAAHYSPWVLEMLLDDCLPSSKAG
jgi:hypothetical protein